MSSRRILAFTGIRSDYDLLAGVYKRLDSTPGVDIGLIVAGAHLSPTFGNTVTLIEADAIPIVARIESLLDSDAPSGRLKSAAILLLSCLHSVTEYAPDVIVVAGDREDAWVGALVASYLKIPSVHFFGGDHASDGNVDNPVRHAVSKLASAHFVVLDAHRMRLRCLGEPDWRIFTIGNPALDRFVEEPLIDRSAVVDAMDRPEWTDYAVVIHHPILGHESEAGGEMAAILGSLRAAGLPAFVSSPNTDAGNGGVREAIKAGGDESWVKAYTNLDRRLFVNLLRHAVVLVGNSSAGLLEAPIIPLPSVNVGARQVGRLAGPSVIFSPGTKVEIRAAIERARSASFRESLSPADSPYGGPGGSARACELLTTVDFTELLYKGEDPCAP